MRFVHLLYVPTMNCNMQCKYCYLGDSTKEVISDKGYLETLEYAVKKMAAADVMPFNISLHGGEVTTLPKENFRELIKYISDYYNKNGKFLSENGFKVGRPHIKTNLLALDKHIETIKEFNVSISGSLDLPLAMHNEYRVTKGGNETLSKIIKNIKLLEELPNHKKVSSTIFKEHYDRFDEIVSDIRFLADNTCLDMNDFNFMIGFKSELSGCETQFTPLSQEEQVDFFRRINTAFDGSDLQFGLDNAWFAEFTQGYCSNCDLCGEKFMLLEKNGDIYSCVRGQGNPDFYYGNIFKDDVSDILANGSEKIFKIHNQLGFSDECANCKFIHLCKTGCPFVKKQYSSQKSYTCLLQQEIYKKNKEEFAGNNFPYVYLYRVHPQIAEQYLPREESYDGTPMLEEMIRDDSKLQLVYSEDAFILEIDGQFYPLKSQLTKSSRQIVYICKYSIIKLHVKKDVFDWLSEYPINNSLYMMLLSGNMVIYGDENRKKQEHIMTHQVFKNTAINKESCIDGYTCVELSEILKQYYPMLPEDIPNNLFFTTSALRDYHYLKQRNNGYYHAKAMNLPFQNIEFIYVNIEEREINV